MNANQKNLNYLMGHEYHFATSNFLFKTRPDGYPDTRFTPNAFTTIIQGYKMLNLTGSNN